jgi:hypothetical protein
MSLHNTVCNKARPVYKCIESLKKYTNTGACTHLPTIVLGYILADFHFSWEYQIDYVESRVPKELIETHFELVH